MNGEHVTLGEADAEVELDVALRRRAERAGTGCVHTAPGHGADDFHIGKKYGLEIYTPGRRGGTIYDEVEHLRARPSLRRIRRSSNSSATAALLVYARITSIDIRTAGDAKIR